MRVTKAVREYIEKQVRAKIEKKYEAEKNESKRIKDIKEDIETRAAEAARQAAIAVFILLMKFITPYILASLKLGISPYNSV